MNNSKSITIAIATYNRPEGLKKLLAGLAVIEIPELVTITVVVADNSADGNAEKQVTKTATNYPWKLVYYHVPERGITYPRNKGLQHALDSNSDYLAYIDDDEVPDQYWLSNLLAEIQKTGTAVLSGAVKPVFEKPPAWWVENGRFFEIDHYPEREPINYAHAGNVIIDMDIIKKLDIKFDPEFGLSGGEDTYFFKMIRNAGYSTMFSKSAIIHEDITSERSRLKWMLKRWYRTGNTDGRVLLKIQPGYYRRLRNITGGIGRLSYGLVNALIKSPLLVVKNPASLEYLRIAMRGMGFITASTGYVFHEYKNHNR